MRLVVWKGGEGSSKLVRAGWQKGESECAWISIGWAPTEEDYLPNRNFAGGEYGFPQISASFIPDDCLVYAELSGGILGETPLMVRDIQERGLRFESPLVMKSFWKRLIKGILEPGDIVFVECNRDFVSYCFEKYGTWMSDIWTFLVSKTSLANWAQQLQYARRGVITKEFLGQIELLFKNRWEHGFEVLSCKLSYDELKDRARKAAQTLSWTFVEAPDSSKETLRGLHVW